MCTDLLQNRARTQHYPTAQQFDRDLTRLFERARRWHAAGSEAYGRCILLQVCLSDLSSSIFSNVLSQQRLYHLLTSPPFPSTPPPTLSNFSSIAAGPGVARPLHSSSESSLAVTTFRIPTKDRSFTEELTYKGMTIRLGDWVHLMNPDDTAKPIIAQVFKTWVPEGDG
jgi:chromatin structure-remodeling complex subunit RSC1/2